MNNNEIFRFAILREPDRELIPDVLTENGEGEISGGGPGDTSEGGPSSPLSDTTSEEGGEGILDDETSACLKQMEHLYSQLMKKLPKDRKELEKVIVDLLASYDLEKLANCKRLLWESLRKLYLADKRSQKAEAARTRALRACAVAEVVATGGLSDETQFKVELRQLLRKPVLIKARRHARPLRPPAKHPARTFPTLEELRKTLVFLCNLPSNCLSRRFESIDMELEYKAEASDFRMSLLKRALEYAEPDERKNLEKLFQHVKLPNAAMRIPQRVLTDTAVKHIPQRVIEGVKAIGVDPLTAEFSTVRSAVRKLHRDALRQSWKPAFAIQGKERVTL